MIDLNYMFNFNACGFAQVNSNRWNHAMRLTNFSDYALRMLIYAATRKNQLITIEETAGRYGVSRAHLMKVANVLTQAGYLKAVRGRSGGLALAKRPDKIRLGEVVRLTEPDFALVECFAPGNRCIITPKCRLRGVLREALAAFAATLDRHTLADLMLTPKDFGIKPAA
jgi:Rrf2 family transcriptional regulator, nitric oxide-sensitive transcriptional repressor